MSYVMYLTSDCNMKCKYCYEQTSRNKLENKISITYDEIKKQLDDSDYRTLKFIDKSYTTEEYEPYRLERITLREKYNLIESCTTQEELDELI